MDRRVLRMLRQARRVSPREAIAFGFVAAVILVVALRAIANEPLNVLAWASAAALIPIGLWGMAVAVTALLRRR